MLASLSKFDQITAAGLLARAALALHDPYNPSAVGRVPEEERIRGELLSEARQAIGVGQDDFSAATLERISDVLDEESDALTGQPDETRVLEDLSQKGALPSDLFNVVSNKYVQRVYGNKFPQEQALIEDTVRSPALEQHYGPRKETDLPAQVSLFMKRFDDRYPIRSFWLLTAGQRRGLTLEIGQAWRIYPDMVEFQDSLMPLDALRNFSEKFGVNVRVGDIKKHFITYAEIESSRVSIEFNPDGPQNGVKEVMGNAFWTHHSQNRFEVSLVNSIDVLRYRKFLTQRGW